VKLSLPFAALAAVVALSGCVNLPPKDYTEFRKNRPRSILILPPINESVDARATYSVLTTATRPIAELGYYVVPVVIADHFLKENGLTMPAEMHQAPLAKLHEVFGADAVLYITIEQYGTKYQVIASNTVVQARAKLVDARSGVMLWEGITRAMGGGQAGLIEAVVEQVMSKLVDTAHVVAITASQQLVAPPQPGQGLLKGFRHPEAAKD
jgi:hypothetical protein